LAEPRKGGTVVGRRLRTFELTVALILGLLLSGTAHAVAAPPTSDSVTPGSGSGSSQTFALQYGDGNGFADIASAFLLINSGTSFPGGCATYYDNPNNAIYLANDAGTVWLGPRTVGQAGTLSNSQCTLDAGASSVSKSGNTLTVNAALTFLAGVAGAKTVSMNVIDAGGLTSNWQVKGSWTVPGGGGGPVAPTADSVTPSSGSGS